MMFLFNKSKIKIYFFRTLLVLIPFIVIESSTRIVTALIIGKNVLFYGTRYFNKSDKNVNNKQFDKSIDHTIKYHENKMIGYSKYFPHEIKRGHNEFESFQVRINNVGFRGDDFILEKPENTKRIVNLGASSTFGYGAKDNQTYPYILNKLLEKESDVFNNYEVMNFGIPHLTTTSICSLFFYEVLKFNPDVVTLYSGMNNAADNIARKPRNVFGEFLIITSYRSLFFELIEKIYNNYVMNYNYSDFVQYSFNKKNIFYNDIIFIYQLCKKNNIEFILLNQQGKSKIIDRNNIVGISYKDEIEIINNKLLSTGIINYLELYLLIHNNLMSDIEKFAKNNNISFLDVIKKTDNRRDVLISWVHLSHEGNKIIAKALFEKIYEIFN